MQFVDRRQKSFNEGILVDVRTNNIDSFKKKSGSILLSDMYGHFSSGFIRARFKLRISFNFTPIKAHLRNSVAYLEHCR